LHGSGVGETGFEPVTPCV